MTIALIDKIQEKRADIFWCILLPVFIILVLFPVIFSGKDLLIGSSQDTLSNIVRYIFLEQHPFAKWNNQWIMGGFPEIASPFSDRYYPLSFPFYFLTKSVYVINVVLLLHLFIAYFSSFKLGSLVTQKRYYLAIGAIFYTFSGILMSRVSVGQNYYIYALAWLPLLYYFFLLILWKNEISLKNFFLITLVAVMLYLSGGLYYFVFSLLMLAIFFSYYVLKREIPREIFVIFLGFAGLFLLIVSFKLIPDILVSPYLVRLDPIDPLSGGGFVENAIASFAFGVPIENFYGMHESMAFLGLIPVLFIIIGYIYGERKITVPAYFSLVFSLIWAAGSNSLLSFIHLLPFFNTLRCPGRIFGALLPILVLLMVYGIIFTIQCINREKKFEINSRQKRDILTGLGVLLAIKLLEFPMQSEITLVSMSGLFFVLSFIGLVYLNKFTPKTLILFLSISVFFSIFMALFTFNIVNPELIGKIVIIGIFLGGIFFYLKMTREKSGYPRILNVIIIFSMLLCIIVNISYISPVYPDLEKGRAKDVASGIAETASPYHQVWVLETGWPYKYLDYTYWDTKYNLAPFTGYYAYYLKDSPFIQYNLNGMNYSIVDYSVDTGFLDNGQQNLPEYTFTISGIGIYKPDLVLPNAFVIGNNGFIPSNITLLTPDKIVINGEFKQGDVALLKTAYYPGWNINGVSAKNTNNLIGSPLLNDDTVIVFSFDPLDFKVGCIFSLIGLSLWGILFYNWDKVNQYLSIKSSVPGRSD